MGLEYAVFAVPAGSEAEIVNAGGAGAAMTSDRVTDLVCTGLDESVAVKVGLVLLLAVGLPEMIPVDASRLSPLGSVLLDQV
jgi:hypothetical protein